MNTDGILHITIDEYKSDIQTAILDHNTTPEALARARVCDAALALSDPQLAWAVEQCDYRVTWSLRPLADAVAALRSINPKVTP